MLGFRKKTVVIEPSPEQLEARRQKQATQKNYIEYIRNPDDKEIFEIFAHAEEQFKYIAKQKNPYNKGGLEALLQVKTAWFRVDTSIATDDQCLRMFETLGYLTATANLYEQQFISSPDAAYTGGYSSNSPSCKPIRQQLAYAYKTISEVEESQRKSKYMPLAQTAVTSSKIQFPAYLHLSNKAVKNSIHDLEELWMLVHAKETNLVEDEYFIEQVAKSYLPDAFKIYQTFQRSTEELQKAADTNLLEQIRLLRMELQRIYDLHSTQSLVMMNTQLDFLRNRIQSTEVSELKLEGVYS